MVFRLTGDDTQIYLTKDSKRGRPAKGELPPEEVRALEEEAASIKGSRYALVKNPEDLTDGQRARLEALKKRAGSRLVRAWELKEDLRAVFRAADGSEAAELLDDWMHRAAYCRSPRSSPWRRRCAAGATTSSPQSSSASATGA